MRLLFPPGVPLWFCEETLYHPLFSSLLSLLPSSIVSIKTFPEEHSTIIQETPPLSSLSSCHIEFLPSPYIPSTLVLSVCFYVIVNPVFDFAYVAATRSFNESFFIPIAWFSVFESFPSLLTPMNI